MLFGLFTMMIPALALAGSLAGKRAVRNQRPRLKRSRGATASLEGVEGEHIARVLAETTTLEEAATTLGINVATLWRTRKRNGIE
jgi:transcriptional regulator with PAS, ATPase and Fis domain